jgi:hypothetical protein
MADKGTVVSVHASNLLVECMWYAAKGIRYPPFSPHSHGLQLADEERGEE